MNGLYYKDQFFSYFSILNSSISVEDKYLSNSLSFCKKWMLGEHFFELQTSGSTGLPKSISIAREQMECSAKYTGDYFLFNENQKILVCLNTAYIAGVMMLVRGMYWNMSIYLIEPCSNPLQEAIKHFGYIIYDFSAMVPMQIQNCLKNIDKRSFDSVKKILIGGAPLNEELIPELKQFKTIFYLSYGMTETVSHIAIQKISPIYQSYFELVNNEIKIELNQNNCLCIYSKLTKNEWISTNDCVELISENSFKWIGRADSVINSGGVKIHPELVEKKIQVFFSTFTINNRFIIVGIPDTRLGEKVILLIEGEIYIEKELSNFLKENLTKYEIPKNIVILEKFAETETKKIKRVDTKMIYLNKM